MDSHNFDTSAVSSSALPDSSIFGDIDKLSPITALKTSLAITGFSDLSSPVVFASPTLNSSAGSYSNKSFQFPLVSSEEICQDRGGKNIEFDSEYIPEKKFQSSISMIECTQKERDNGFREDHFSTPSGRFDKYLVDSVEAEHESTEASHAPRQLNQCPDSQSKCESIDNVRQDTEEAMVTFSDMLQLEDRDFQQIPSFNEKPIETNANNEGNDLHSRSKNTGSEHKDTSDGVSEFLPQSENIVIGYEDGSKTTGEVSCENYEDVVLHVSKGQRSSGLQRRRLQFEEADHCVTGATLGSWNQSNAETNQRSPCPVELEVLEPPESERTAISGGSHTAISSQPISMISFKRPSITRSRVSKPSGIGLHLNSIISSNPKCVSTGVSITSDDKGCLDVQGEKLAFCSGHYPQESSYNGSLSLRIGERFSTSSQNQEVSDSLCPEFSSPSDPVFSDYQATPCGKRKFTLEQACAFEETSQSSPKKRSKKELASIEGDGCKRCNCKKTKCLKLYCDCFAAGMYCTGICSCQGCYNRPEFVDKVLEVREQIESRNPLAFAPKIVERLIESHVDSTRKDENNSTPASARHKRGCNCKKSMCMKKYCECYQNNVGCSIGCRCEGCQNVYGKKEDCHGANDALGVPILEARDENVDLVPNENSFLQKEPSNHLSGTPITPSFQLLKKYITSPESDLSMMPNCRGSLRNTDNDSVILKSMKKHVVSSHPEYDCGDDGLEDVFSPTDKLANIDKSNKAQNSRYQLPFENGNLSSASSLDRCRAKFDNIHEDDTPEILKDPINCVKVCSPNKKRVSPPRMRALRQLGSSLSSAGLKSGRKFILRALPGFPPLMPCIDGKDSNNQSKRT